MNAEVSGKIMDAVTITATTTSPPVKVYNSHGRLSFHVYTPSASTLSGSIFVQANNDPESLTWVSVYFFDLITGAWVANQTLSTGENSKIIALDMKPSYVRLYFGYEAGSGALTVVASQGD